MSGFCGCLFKMNLNKNTKVADFVRMTEDTTKNNLSGTKEQNGLI